MARLQRPSGGGAATKVAESGYVEAFAAPLGRCNYVAKRIPVNDVIAGGCARAASQSTIHPLDTVKVRMQALAGKGKAAQEAAAAQKAAKAVSTGKYGVERLHGECRKQTRRVGSRRFSRRQRVFRAL